MLKDFSEPKPKPILEQTAYTIRKNKSVARFKTDLNLVYGMIKAEKEFVLTADICSFLNNHMDRPRGSYTYNSMDFGGSLGRYLKDDPRFVQKRGFNKQGLRSALYGLAEWDQTDNQE